MDKAFTVKKRDSGTGARIGVIRTAHGPLQTPAFVPVGTQGTVKSLSPDDLADLDVGMFFVNTYHIYLRPGLDVIRAHGGIHPFMGWKGAVITDSGGFQAFSLARPSRITQSGAQSNTPSDDTGQSLVSIDDEGITFRSHWDGSRHRFTPEVSIHAQEAIGSDLRIAFDECATYPVSHAYAKKAMERSHAWGERSIRAQRQLKSASLLYGVVQGSVYDDLRSISAKEVAARPYDGIAIGGLSVGESKAEMERAIRTVRPYLPDAKPVHALGVGAVEDIFLLVGQGIDTFDCVLPTRYARSGFALRYPPMLEATLDTRMDLNKSAYVTDVSPIDSMCDCICCRTFTRSYLHHLFRVRELLAYRLVSIHNIRTMNRIVRDVRLAIEQGTFATIASAWEKIRTKA